MRPKAPPIPILRSAEHLQPKYPPAPKCAARLILDDLQLSERHISEPLQAALDASSAGLTENSLRHCFKTMLQDKATRKDRFLLKSDSSNPTLIIGCSTAWYNNTGMLMVRAISVT